MSKLIISSSKTYEVLAEPGLLARSGILIREALGSRAGKLCIVTDDIVDSLYSGALCQSLKSAGFKTEKFVFPNGEASKNMDTLASLLEFLAQKQLTRSDALVALGGGVVGDLAGFAASVYLRGVAFVQIPTTLLAAVDSSVGGKTGVNLQAGKNLAGAFWQPSLVLFDMDTIRTLSCDLLLDGAAEVVKAGAIGDKALLACMAQADTLDNPEIIAPICRRAIEIKGAVVKEDERDTGARQLLNFGHTIGHAAEACSGFTISHGRAVALGMAMTAKAALRMGWSQEDCFEPLFSILKKLGFPLECPYTPEQLARAALQDKKRMGDTIALIVPIVPGRCRRQMFPISELETFIKAGLL